MRPKVFLFSCLTSILISPFILSAMIANFSWGLNFILYLFTIIPVFICGIACASINELIYAKVRRRGVYLIFESIVILVISLIGSFIMIGVISEGNAALSTDAFIFLGYGYICAINYQVSTHIYAKAYRF
jgi:hypothetical protein